MSKIRIIFDIVISVVFMILAVAGHISATREYIEDNELYR